MSTEERERGCVVAITGAPQSGKSTAMRAEVADHKRVMVFGDWRGEYQADGYTPVRGPRELVEIVKRDRKGPGRYAYRGNLADFDAWCFAVFRWLQLFPGTVIVDELAGPTGPGKAPRNWGEILRMSAGFGGWVYGCTQRMAESDTTIWGVADVLRSHRLVRSKDAERMAAELNCRAEDLLELPPFQYLQRESHSREFERFEVPKP